ncbi:9111_t:CDS:2 [Racocetra persica]|uniref:9111_t:CDS:1 n=1 Tax=Racocetra persica TaxID=160502 RepID=A0ACA9N0Z2_9GLOM|nr:9111_t:CDS:2 [Racocetra persica]
MRRVQTKKVTQKVGLQRCIVHKSSNQIQNEFVQLCTYYTSQDIRNQASLHLENYKDYSNESLQESFSEESQHVNNDFECSFSIDLDMLSSELDTLSSMSNTLSSSNQLIIMEEVGLQSEVTQTIVDSGIDFQPLSGEYGPYFKNFTEMSLFIWVTKYMIRSFIKYKDKETKIGRILAIVSTSNGTKLKIQHLYFGSELPRIFASSIRKERSKNGELWLSKMTYLTDLFNVIEPVTVWLQDTLELPNYQFNVREILYCHKGQWKIRDCKLRHLHPIEYTQIPMSTPHNVPTLKIMLDIYHDDFGTFHNVYHSLGRIYLQFCNMPLRLRKQLKNHFVLGFVPFGGEFDDVMKPIIDEIKILEKDILINIAGEYIWIIATLGVITADLP